MKLYHHFKVNIELIKHVGTKLELLDVRESRTSLLNWIQFCLRIIVLSHSCQTGTHLMTCNREYIKVMELKIEQG